MIRHSQIEYQVDFFATIRYSLMYTDSKQASIRYAGCIQPDQCRYQEIG